MSKPVFPKKTNMAAIDVTDGTEKTRDDDEPEAPDPRDGSRETQPKFLCTICPKRFDTAEKVQQHRARMHQLKLPVPIVNPYPGRRYSVSKTKPCAEVQASPWDIKVELDQDQRITAIDGVPTSSRPAAAVKVTSPRLITPKVTSPPREPPPAHGMPEETPTPTRLLSALERDGIFEQTPFRNLMADNNPFNTAFRTGLGIGLGLTTASKASSTEVVQPKSPSEINPLLFAPTLSPGIFPFGHHTSDPGGVMVFSPGGQMTTLHQPGILVPATYLQPVASTTQMSSSAGFSQPMGYFSFLPPNSPGIQYYQLAQQQKTPSKVPVTIEEVSVPTTSAPRTTVAKEPPSPKPLVQRTAVSLSNRGQTVAEANALVRQMLKRRMDDFLASQVTSADDVTFSDDMSEVSTIEREMTPPPGSREGTPSGSQSTPGAKKSRPVLETDDPVLADKRRRNRIAAEKCRKKRKERQEGLESDNQSLKEKYQQLNKDYKRMTSSSKSQMEELMRENELLRQENIELRSRLGMELTKEIPRIRMVARNGVSI